MSNILNDAEVVRSTRRRQGVNVVMAQAILERAAVRVAQKTVESALKDRDEKYEYITQMDRRDVLDRAGVRARDESSNEISITFVSGGGVSVGMPQGTQDEDAAQVELLGNAGARSLDALVRDELATCTNVIYAGGKSSRSALTAADKLTSVELRKAVRTLKKSLAQPFGGYFVAIVGPDVIYDLQDDEAFVKVSAYQDKENIYTGEVGRLYGVRFVETTEAKIFDSAGASGADVASVIVLGKDAYGMTGIGGKTAPHVIVKPAGSAGTNDPLDQINTVGWKLDGFAVKLLQSEYAVRIECGFSQ